MTTSFETYLKEKSSEYFDLRNGPAVFTETEVVRLCEAYEDGAKMAWKLATQHGQESFEKMGINLLSTVQKTFAESFSDYLHDVIKCAKCDDLNKEGTK